MIEISLSINLSWFFFRTVNDSVLQHKSIIIHKSFFQNGAVDKVKAGAGAGARVRVEFEAGTRTKDEETDPTKRLKPRRAKHGETDQTKT